MSVVVIYFGFKADGTEGTRLRHHNIILGPRYEKLLKDIFHRKVLSPDFSQYLHIPTLTDPSLAPEGHHAAYTLIPVAHNGSGLDWSLLGEGLPATVSMKEKEVGTSTEAQCVVASYLLVGEFLLLLGGWGPTHVTGARARRGGPGPGHLRLPRQDRVGAAPAARAAVSPWRLRPGLGAAEGFP
jgi:hypothetical protein